MFHNLFNQLLLLNICCTEQPCTHIFVISKSISEGVCILKFASYYQNAFQGVCIQFIYHPVVDDVMMAFVGYLLCVRDVLSVVYVFSFNPPNTLIRWILLLPSYYRWNIWKTTLGWFIFRKLRQILVGLSSVIKKSQLLKNWRL